MYEILYIYLNLYKQLCIYIRNQSYICTALGGSVSFRLKRKPVYMIHLYTDRNQKQDIEMHLLRSQDKHA